MPDRLEVSIAERDSLHCDYVYHIIMVPCMCYSEW